MGTRQWWSVKTPGTKEPTEMNEITSKELDEETLTDSVSSDCSKDVLESRVNQVELDTIDGLAMRFPPPIGE
jgi:hypothetical protein